MRLSVCVVLGLSLGIAVGGPVRAAQRPSDHVIVVSLDGLAAYLFDDPSAPLPTVRALAAHGVVAEGMTVSNPSVTWPNHTTLVTGVRPDLHGVLFNGVLEKGGPGQPVKVNPKKTRDELVHAPTVYDLLHHHGLSTAGINWPCTRETKTIADDFPDVPDTLTHTTPRFLEALDAGGVLPAADRAGFSKLSPSARDLIWTRAACLAVSERKPNLLLFHLLNIDASQHKYGPQSIAGYSAVAYADSCLKMLVDAVDAAGLRSRTTFLIVADHGFMAIPKTLQPNVVLRQAGLLTVEGTQIVTARAQAIPEGGIAMLYLTDREKKADDQARVIELFKALPEIADVLAPDEFPKYGLPNPHDNPEMADLILVARDGYGFSATATGDDFVVPSEATIGTHGFLSTNPKMNAVFVASGAGIKKGEKLGIIDNVDVAPTIAALLGLKLTTATGKPLAAALAVP